jgi:hypothetical protein
VKSHLQLLTNVDRDRLVALGDEGIEAKSGPGRGGWAWTWARETPCANAPTGRKEEGRQGTQQGSFHHEYATPNAAAG